MVGILLATDGSDCAKRAGDHAINIANDRKIPLHVLCVVDRREFDETALSSSELACIQAEDHGHECVADVADEARAAGLDVVTDVRHGIPEQSIIAYADKISANIIVMGEHGDHTEHLSGVGRRVKADSGRKTIVIT